MRIANARMYSVSAETSALWRSLLLGVAARAGLPLTLIEHAAPRSIDELWQRADMGAVFMCGLPYSRAEQSRAERRPVLVAAPAPVLPEFGGRAEYWSEFVVRADSAVQSLEDTFGQRLALTVPDSQSGCVAALTHLMSVQASRPLYREVIAPTVTPLGAISAVLNQEADVAPIDAYALRLLQRYRPDLTTRLRIVARTLPTPIPVLVASTPDVEALRAAFLGAHQDPGLKILLDGLLLQGFTLPDSTDYRILAERSLAAAVYWREHPLATVIHPAFA